ncbi:MAG: response regulator transcription factor [Melioribacteraceae bacterium]|nr:response regulator transcription factor [Melioribacteraceae bacterium]
MKILIVEDNIELAKGMASILLEEGYIIENSFTFNDGLEKISIYATDLVIVDIGLPDGNGLDLIRSLKENKNNCGVLIVSAKNSIEDKVSGLEIGADDYITKPFHNAELVARVKSILRRKNFEGSNIFEINEIKIDIQNLEVFVKEQKLTLTKKEYELLLYFIYNKNRVLTKESIAEHLWGDHVDMADNFDFIYNHIKNLRKKLTAIGCTDYINSVYGMGYKFRVDNYEK